jgi:hypothetical protein
MRNTLAPRSTIIKLNGMFASCKTPQHTPAASGSRRQACATHAPAPDEAGSRLLQPLPRGARTTRNLIESLLGIATISLVFRRRSERAWVMFYAHASRRWGMVYLETHAGIAHLRGQLLQVVARREHQAAHGVVHQPRHHRAACVALVAYTRGLETLDGDRRDEVVRL